MSNDFKRLERVEIKIDDLNDHLASIDTTLKSQHISLKEHIRRTEILERSIIPIRRHVDRVQGVLMFILGVGGIWAILEFVVRK